MHKRIITLCLLTASIFISCATTPQGPEESSEKNFLLREDKEEIKEIQKLLKEASYSLTGKEQIVVKGRKFNKDCSGVVSALYYYAGIDLQKFYPGYSGTGTERIYKMLDERGLLENTWMPETGDIIFWDNTYDKNGNGKRDDPLTHIGMVVNTDKFGNIEYIHHNYLKGVVIENMNIRYKNDYIRSKKGVAVIINSPMKKKGGTRNSRDKWLSGQLYNSSGRAYEIAD